jgi:pyridoxine 4-dehydrogenase
MQTLSRRSILRLAGGVALSGMAQPLFAAAATAALPNAAAAGSFAIGGDLTVHRMGFGALRILGPGLHGYPADPAEARRVLRRALDLGVNLIDTADAYGPYVSERLIYDALYPYPKHLVIATKGGLIRPGPNPDDADGSPKHLREACEGSLRRLHLERIDLYYLHVPDPKRPIEESIGALEQLRTEGKIRHIGVSNVNLDQLQRCLKITKLVAATTRYNVNDRNSEDVLRFCEARGLAFVPWAPLGRLPGRPDEVVAPPVDRLAPLEKNYDISPQQAALAWLLSRSKSIITIPGTSSVAHLQDDIAAASIHFTSRQMAAIG